MGSWSTTTDCAAHIIPRTRGERQQRRHLERADFDALRSAGALTEGIASMELRGTLRDASDPERIWRSSIEALLRGFDTSTPAGDAPAR